MLSILSYLVPGGEGVNGHATIGPRQIFIGAMAVSAIGIVSYAVYHHRKRRLDPVQAKD